MWWFIVLLIVGCVGSPTGAVVQEQDIPVEMITLGVIAPMTGAFAEWGESIVHGLEMVESDIQLNVQDSGCEPQKTVTALQYLMDQGITIIMGPGCLTGLRAIASIADREGILLFSTGLLDDDAVHDTVNVINLATQISTEATQMAEHILQDGQRRVAVVHGTNYFGQEHGRRLPEQLGLRGIEVTGVYPTDLGETDFRSLIKKIMDESPHGIFIHQGEQSLGLFAKGLKEIGFEGIPLYSTYGAEAQSVLDAGGIALEGLEYTYPYNPMNTTWFEDAYSGRFASHPTATSLFVYDGLKILHPAIELCQNNIECIKEYFTSIGQYTGVSGEMYFNPDGSTTRPFGIKVIQDGAFVWIKKS